MKLYIDKHYTCCDIQIGSNQVNVLKQEKLIPNLPTRTAYLIYNAMQKDECPTSAPTEQEIKDWLQKQSIRFENTLLKSELYHVVLSNKPVCKLVGNTYVIDELLQKHQHTTLQLPSFNSDLNAIEPVWASLKEYAAKKNISFKNLCEKVFKNIPLADWAARCTRA